MNPFLEQEDVWHDFHKSYLPRIRDHIAAQLADHYVVKIDEHIYIHEPSAEQRVGDVFVATRQPPASSSGLATAASGPAQVVLPAVDVEGVSFLEIRDRRDRRLVTVVELLSPSNKYQGPDRDQYLAKRGKLLASAAHLVEIDLLRGPRMRFAGPLPACDYYALVSRMQARPRADFWPIRLRDPLPVIPIPLREPDPDASLDLQAVLHDVYDAARYRTFIYESPPQPALTAADDAWARELWATHPG